MSDNSRIEWTDATWNPITGCSPISEGCENCYAQRMASRLRGRCGYPQDDPFRPTFHEDKLLAKFLYSKKLKRIFACSMGDLFHKDVPDAWIKKVVSTAMVFAERHNFIFLTKRPERMQEIMQPPYWTGTNRNIWFGVTAENQERADERIPILMEIQAAVRFVSVEPMLGPVDLSDYLSVPCRACNHPGNIVVAMNGNGRCSVCDGERFVRPLHWVICGGETGPRSRVMNCEWVSSLSEQCERAGVPFFFKKWGSATQKVSGDPVAHIERREFPMRAQRGEELGLSDGDFDERTGGL